MAAKGVVDDADYLIGSHFMMPKVGFLAYDVQNFLATSKLNVDFTGLAAHAGGAPEQGKNALLAAAAAEAEAADAEAAAAEEAEEPEEEFQDVVDGGETEE